MLRTAFLSAMMIAAASAAAAAGGASSGPVNPPGKLTVGAGYERYQAEWVGNDHPRIRDVSQNRIFLQVDHRPAQRLRLGARLGTADLSAPDLAIPDFCQLGYCQRPDYGFSPFASINLNWTPIGALPGTWGGAIEVVFEVSAFGTYSADRIEGVYLGWSDYQDFEAWPEASSVWEGKVGFLLVTQNGSSRFGAGLMYLESGAEVRTRIRNEWYDGTETDYVNTLNNIGLLGAWRFSPGGSIVVDAEVGWTGPTLQFELSLSRVLMR